MAFSLREYRDKNPSVSGRPLSEVADNLWETRRPQLAQQYGYRDRDDFVRRMGWEGEIANDSLERTEANILSRQASTAQKLARRPQPSPEAGALRNWGMEGYASGTPIQPRTSQPEPSKGALSDIGRGLAAGLAMIPESMGAGIEWLGRRAGSESLAGMGKRASDVWGDIREDYGPPAEIAGRNVIDDPGVLAEGSYWLYTIPQILPSLAATLVPGAVAHKLISAGPKAIQGFARLGQWVASGAAGGGMEATSTYKQLLKEGVPEQEAARAAEIMFFGTAGLSALGSDKILKAAGDTFKKKVLKTLGAGVWEGITEGLEEPWEVVSILGSKLINGEPLPDDIKGMFLESLKEGATVAPAAAVTGAGVAAISSPRDILLDESEKGKKAKDILLGEIQPRLPDAVDLGPIRRPKAPVSGKDILPRFGKLADKAALIEGTPKTPEDRLAIQPRGPFWQEQMDQMTERLGGKVEPSALEPRRLEAMGKRTAKDRLALELAGKRGRLTKLDEAAHKAATSPLNDTPEPTEAQKEAGNYKKGHINIQGLDVAIENPAGSERSGTDPDGKPWSVPMQHHYGYFARSEGKDGDQIDVFVGPNPEGEKAYIVDQVDPKTGEFDEHKTLIGFDSEEDARAGYLANYEEGWQGLGAITEMPIDKFKEWVKKGRQTKPVALGKEAKDAEGIRKDEGQIPGGGPTEETGAEKGRTDLELETPEEPGRPEGEVGKTTQQPKTWRELGSIIGSKVERPLKPSDEDITKVSKELGISKVDTRRALDHFIHDDEEIVKDRPVPMLKGQPSPTEAITEKQPWEITAQQWREMPLIEGEGPYWSIFNRAIMAKATFEEAKKSATRQALRDGVPVPPEVLAEYPDLKKPEKPAKPKEPSPIVSRVENAFKGRERSNEFTKIGQEVFPEVRLQEAEEAGRWAYQVAKGEATQEEFDAWKDRMRRENRTREKPAPAREKEAGEDKAAEVWRKGLTQEGRRQAVIKAGYTKKDAESYSKVLWDHMPDTMKKALAPYLTAEATPEATPAAKDTSTIKAQDATADDLLAEWDRQVAEMEEAVQTPAPEPARPTPPVAHEKAGEKPFFKESGPAPAKPAPTPTVSEKAGETVDHIKNAIDKFKEINKILGEEGALSGKEVDMSKYDMIKPLLQEAWSEIMAAGKSAKEFVQIALQSLSPKGRPYFEKFVREEISHETRGSGDRPDSVEGDLESEVGVPAPVRTETDREVVSDESEGTVRRTEAGGAEGTPLPGQSRSGQEPGEGSGRRDSAEHGGTVRGGTEGTATGEAGSGDSGVGVGSTGVPSRRGQGEEGLREEDQNHVIAPDDVIFPPGAETKIRANITAIKLLRKLQAEDRNPTPAEKKTLAQYVGWGQFSQKIFDSKFSDIATRYGATPNLISFPGWTNQEREEIRDRYTKWVNKYGKDLHPALGGLLTQEEWASAEISTINAHFTSKPVIQKMWDLARRLGFDGGLVAEPAGGVGHFFGLMPQDLAQNSALYAIEKDTISGAILQKLYPQARVDISPFERSKLLLDNSIDLQITNVPFANIDIIDKKHPDYSGWSLHNYYFGRMLTAAKPGGLILAVTTSWTMDAKTNVKIREYLADKADLLGAIRLPNTAFKKGAGTEVTTDIIVLRKKSAVPIKDAGIEFANTQRLDTAENRKLLEAYDVAKAELENAKATKLPKSASSGQKKAMADNVKSCKNEVDRILTELQAAYRVNEYFINNPGMVLGKHSMRGSMHAGDTYTVEPTGDLEEMFNKAMDAFPENVAGEATDISRMESEKWADKGDKEGTLTRKDGEIYLIENGRLVEPVYTMATGKDVVVNNKAKLKCLSAYLDVRDAVSKLRDLMITPEATDIQIKRQRDELNRVYDAYVKNFDAFGAKTNAWVAQVDGDFGMVDALEIEERVLKDGKKYKIFKKADIFFKRTQYPFMEPDTASDIKDAVNLSIVYRGGIVPEYIGKLIGNKNIESVKAQIIKEGLAFVNPETGILEPRDLYLSGNVKKKLAAAKAAKESGNNAYDKNIKELESILPEDIDIEFVTFRLGSAWIPSECVHDFVSEFLGVDAEIQYVTSGEQSRWVLTGKDGVHDTKNMETYGTPHILASELVEKALNLKRTEIKTPTKDGKSLAYNEEATKEANLRMKELQEHFARWAKTHDKWASELTKIYNEEKNGVVLRKHAEPPVEHYPNASTAITLRPHQKIAVSRALNESTLLAYGVGTGKTYIYITTAMEMRRIGTAKKPCIVVHNQTIDQYRKSFQTLYPGAKVLIPNYRQRSSRMRKKTLASIATGNWDAVVLPQSFFDGIANDPTREIAFVEDRVAEIDAAIKEATDEEGEKSFTVKDLVKLKERKRQQLQALLDRRKDESIFFEQMGIDALLIDEVHAYKRSEFFTKMNKVKGIDSGSSQRSTSLMLKSQFVRHKTGGKNVITATGTPISNTMAELWTMLRYVRPELLDEYGVGRFDEFAAAFGNIVGGLEETPSGFKEVERFAEYVNGPELLTMFFSGADVRLTKDANLKLPKIKGGKPEIVLSEKSPELRAFLNRVIEQWRRWEGLSGKEKRENRHVPLVLYGLAKKATIDLRLVDPEVYGFDPNSKIGRTVEKVYKIWTESKADKGAQIVFLDNFQDNAKRPKFNAHKDIKNRLIQKGVPASEIVLFGDVKESRADEVKEKIRKGEIRVVIGTTQKLGVGVDIADKMVGEHHVSVPDRPMDIEQRVGRVIRQTNENDEVAMFHYCAKDTLDSVLFHRLLKKQKFSDQVLTGDIEGRTFADPYSEEQVTFAEFAAAASGEAGKLLLEKNELMAEEHTYKIDETAYIRKVSNAKAEIRSLKNDIPEREQELAKAKEISKKLQKMFPSSKVDTVTYDGRTMERSEFLDIVEAKLQEFANQAKKSFDGKTMEQAKEEKIWAWQRSIAAKAEDVDIVLNVFVQSNYSSYEGAKDKVVVYDDLEVNMQVEFGGEFLDAKHFNSSQLKNRFTRICNDALAAGISQDIERIEYHLDKAKASLEEYQSISKKPFQYTEKLAEIRRRIADIDTELIAISREVDESAEGAGVPVSSGVDGIIRDSLPDDHSADQKLPDDLGQPDAGKGQTPWTPDMVKKPNRSDIGLAKASSKNQVFPFDLHGKEVFSNGQFLDMSEPPYPNFAEFLADKRNIFFEASFDKFVSGAVHDIGKPEFRKEAKKPGDRWVVFRAPGDQPITIAESYFNYFESKYGQDTTYHSSGAFDEPIIVKSNGDVVGLVMPIKPLEEDGIQFSRHTPAHKAPITPVRATAVKADVNRAVNKHFKGLEGLVNVVQSETDLPADVFEAVKAAGMEGKYNGFKLRGQVYIVADNLSSRDAGRMEFIEQLLAHEGRHWAFEKIIPNPIDRRRFLRQVDEKYKTEIDAFMSEYDVSDRVAAAEEVLVSQIRKGKTGALIDRFISKVMQWLRRVFPGIKVTRAEVRDLIERAEAMMARAREETAVGINQFAQPVRFSLKEAVKKITDNPNFKRWFGSSKVVDENGEPLVVYHGTVHGFSAFAPSFEVDDIGFHFGTKYQAESRLQNRAQRRASYAGRGLATETADYLGSNLMPVYLSIQNPLTLPDAGMWDAHSIATILELKKGKEDNRLTKTQIQKIREIGNSDRINRTVKLKEYLESLDYDGIKYRNKHEGGGTSYIAFHPTQIKSIFNTTFDPENPDIRYQLAGKQAKNTPTGQLAKAQQMLAEGKSEQEIWDATGWTKEASGKWAFRIDDSGAKLKKAEPESSQWGDLSEFLDHPELFKAYPQLKTVLTQIMIDPDAKEATGSFREYQDRSAEGLFDIQPEIHVIAPTLETAKSGLLHEVQHAIQDIEGFARGGSPDIGRAALIEHLEKQLVKTQEKIEKTDISDYDEFSGLVAKKDNLEGEILTLKNPFLKIDAGYKAYKNFAGEIYARETGAQFQGLPGTMEGIPRDQWIVRDGEGTSFSVTDESGETITLYHGSPEPEITEIRDEGLLTYDDAGNIIPLSQRFDTKKDDIRFQRKQKAAQGAAYDAEMSEDPTVKLYRKSTALQDLSRESLEPNETKRKLGLLEDLGSRDGLISDAIESAKGMIERRGKGWVGVKDDISTFDTTLGLLSHASGKSPALDRAFNAATSFPDISNEIKEDLIKNPVTGRSTTDFWNALHKASKRVFDNVSNKLVEDDINEVGYRVFEDDNGVHAYTKNAVKHVSTHETKAKAEMAAQRLRDRMGDRVSVEVREGDKEDQWHVVQRARGEKIGTFSREEEAWAAARQHEAEQVRKIYGDLAADAVRASKGQLDRAFMMLTENLRSLYRKKLSHGLPPVVEYTTMVGNKVQVNLQDAIARISDLRGHYFPRIRKPGQYLVYANKQGERTVMQTFDRKAAADAYEARMIKRGWETRKTVSSALPEDVFEMWRQVVGIQTQINEALDRIQSGKVTLEDFGLQHIDRGAEGRRDFAVFGPIGAAGKEVFKEMGGQWYSAQAGEPKGWHFINPGRNFEQRLAKALAAKVDVIDQRMTDLFAQALTENMANVIREHGHRAHMIRRKQDVVTGYETDPRTVFPKYASGIAAGQAKGRLAMQLAKAGTGTDISWNQYKGLIGLMQENTELQDYDEFQLPYYDLQITPEEHAQMVEIAQDIGPKGKVEYENYRQFMMSRRIDPAKQANAFKAYKQLSETMLRNQESSERVVGFFKGLAVFKYLAFRVFSAPLINLTALPTSATASMSGYAGISLPQSMRYITRGIKAYGQFRLGHTSSMDPDLLTLFKDMQKKGWDNPQFNQEAFATLKNRFGRGWEKLIECGMFTFGASETLNRAATISGAYMALKDQAKKTGKTFNRKEAMAKAKEISDKAHGIYDKANKPMVIMGAGYPKQVGQAFYMYRTFAYSYLLTMKDLGFKMGPLQVGKGQTLPFLYMLSAPAILAGAGASVATPFIAAMLKGLTDSDDPEEDFYRWLYNEIGAPAERAARFGLFGMAGLNLKGSLEIGLMDVPTKAADLLGAPGSVLADLYQGTEKITKGQVSKGVEQILPLGWAAPIKSYREATEGLTTRTNAPLFYGREQVKLEGAEVALRALAFNPARIAGIREEQWSDTRTAAKWTERKSDINARIKKFYLLPISQRSKGRWGEILAMIQDYNNRVRRTGAATRGLATYITSDSIKRSLRMSFRPSKRERLRDAA